ncbi:MAG: GHKL domain-containing protein [Lachnospiraceae bacterium]|nr:GHKL domain-containing protein [Lachnospiraceae bacterium]
MDYHICVDHAECRLALHELIEILGILLTNAAESMDDRKVEQVIDLTVLEDTQYLQIKVGNEGPYLTADHARKIFQEGYSSKGENRGLGLARVEQLKKECMAEIIIENSTRMDQNWVFFQVVIPK